MSNISLPALELVAMSDPATFSTLVEGFGLSIIGTKRNDSLNRSVMAEEVESIASIMEDNSIDDLIDVTRDQVIIKQMAEKLGYIVRVN